MCYPEKRRHTRTSANHAGISHLLAGASFQPVDRLVTPPWVGYFGVSPGSDSYTHYKPVLGPNKLSYVLDHIGSGENTFYVEGLAFPDVGFSGLVSFSASLLEVPHKVRGVCPIPCKVLQWWGFQPLLPGVSIPHRMRQAPQFSRIRWFSAWRPG